VPYDAPEPHDQPKLSPSRGSLVAVVVICFLALAAILGASFAVWLAL
jgi:hypothetical protein